MIKSLAKFTIACVVVASMAGCAVSANDREASEDLATIEQAIGGKKSDLLPITIAAYRDPVTGKTQLDVTTSPSFDLPNDILHKPDQFRAVAVYLVSPNGAERLLDVFGGNQIGPGGGCIHFSDLDFNSGDRVRVGAVVQLMNTKGAQVGASTVVTVVDGTSNF